MCPTYLYRNKVSRDVVEVVQRIVSPPFTVWGDIFEYKSGNPYIGSDKNDPVERVPNWEGTATMHGGGVYKQGTIAAASKAVDKQLLGSTRYSVDDIINRKDEDDE